MNDPLKIEVKSTYDLLKRGEQEIQLSDEYKDVVLLFGDTGAGKTTFTQWIAGDNNKLLSKEVAEGTGEFIIEDSNNKISNSTIKSKTVFPELVIDAETNTAYYDCPGFSDTRSTSNDIATTYFIKKVLDHAESVKMIFVTSYPSVRKGVDRHKFMDLIKHSTELVKDIDKFKSSIAIIITKVDNQYVKQGKSLTLVDDDKVIGAIADFIMEVKCGLEEELNLSKTLTEKQKFHNSAIKFIDILLEKKDNHYSKIGIFRRPDEPGLLSNITLLQEAKFYVKGMINNKISFTKKDNNNFGYTLSEKSKNDINDLVEEINKSLWSNVDYISKQVQKFYHRLVDEICSTISSFNGKITVVSDVESKAKIFSLKFNNGYTALKKLLEGLKNLTNFEELAGKINDTVTDFDIDVAEDNILDLATQGKFLKFLQTVSNKKLNIRPASELFNDIIPHVSKLREDLESSIQDVAESLLHEHINDIAESMYDHFNKKIKTIEIRELPAELKKEQDELLKLIEEIENFETLLKLSVVMQTINNYARNLGIGLFKNNIKNVVNRNRYFNSIYIINEKEVKISQTLIWIRPLKDVIMYLNKSEKWYKFLNSLYLKFSEYEVQNHRGKILNEIQKNESNDTSVENWHTKEILEEVIINKDNLKNFLIKVSVYNIAEYDNIKNIQFTRLQLDELNHLLKVTLKSRVNINCIEPYIFIKGNYIQVKNIVPYIMTQNNVDIEDNCKNLLGKEFFNSNKIKFINVFALNTIFIDKNLSLENKFTLTFIAPDWKVIGTKVIKLDGVNGKALDGTAGWEMIKRDGRPGQAGGPGGNFFGVGKKFIDGINLSISVNGGAGGPGQEGSKGSSGGNGSSPSVPGSAMFYFGCYNTSCENGEDYNGYDCNFISSQPYSYKTAIKSSLYYRLCQISYGTPGKVGENGGDGGKGGRGGLPGDIKLVELNDYSGILVYNNTGQDGYDGVGGEGGSGGFSGDDIYICCRIIGGWDLMYTTRRKSKDGKNGEDGANKHNMEYPVAAKIFNKQDKSKIINEYKIYLIKNLNDRFKKSFLIEFLDQLNNNSQVKNNFTTLGLLNEFEGLEEQFYKLNDDIHFLSFYKSLLHRISEYAQKSTKVGEPNKDKKTLTYLYTAVLGRVYNLQKNFESSLIVDVPSYLNSVLEDIDKLKNLNLAKNKMDVINKYAKEYKNQIDAEIKEAENYVSNGALTEMNDILNEVDHGTELLIYEVKVFENLNAEQISKLKDLVAMKILFKEINFFDQVLSVLIRIGATLSSIVSESENAEFSVTDSQSNDSEFQKCEISVKKILDQIKFFNSSKRTRFEKILENILLGIAENPEELGSISVKIISIKERLNKINENNFNLKQIKLLENELKSILRIKEEELKKTNKDTNESKNIISLIKISDFTKSIELNEAVFDIYENFKNDRKKLDAIYMEFYDEPNQFKKFKEHEEETYGSLSLILQNILHDLRKATSEKSKVAFHLSTWQVQNFLKLQLQKLTRKFQVPKTSVIDFSSLVFHINKLKDGIIILINVYDHLQDYQEHLKFATFIADISSSTTKDTDFIDDYDEGNECKNAEGNLEIVIRSSIVLQRYQVAIDAFKMFVFPFANEYLTKVEIPSHLQSNENIKNNSALENLVNEAKIQIEHIRSRLNLYNASLSEQDQEIGYGEFGGDYGRPFCVWKNSEYKNAISNLLSGQEVIIKADIRSSPQDMDAIKFTAVGLNFKLSNEELQSEFEKVLEGFKISMTHLGNSYYRYNKKIYLIPTKSLKIWYYFIKQKNSDVPVHTNSVYNKLKQGNFMLSPYALWKMQLKTVEDMKNSSFKNLEIFEDKIDLQLEGYANYVIREEINEDLEIEKYYEAIDDDLDLFLPSTISNEELSTDFQRNISFERNKRESYENFKYNTVNTADGKSLQKYSSWFSWLQLPNFSIIPGVEAVVLEDDEVFSVEKVHKILADNILTPVTHSIKLLKDAILSKMLPPLKNISSYKSSEKIINNCTDYIREENKSNSSEKLLINFSKNKSNDLKISTPFDVHGNLILGQLIIHKVFGNNESLHKNSYISPKQERNIKINKLISEILPINIHDFSVNCETVECFVNNYKNASQWYQDMYKDEFEEIVSNGCPRND